MLERAEIQARLHLPPDQQFSRPESGLVRTLYDCPGLPLLPQGKPCRIVIATHPASGKKSRVGVTRAGVVYELFLTNLPQAAFTASDVLALYLHRGAFETTLADEDAEQDPDRRYSPGGQESWQIISQWVWNLRLELGHQLELEPLCTVSRLLPPPNPQQKRKQLALRLQPVAMALPRAPCPRKAMAKR